MYYQLPFLCIVIFKMFITCKYELVPILYLKTIPYLYPFCFKPNVRQVKINCCSFFFIMPDHHFFSWTQGPTLQYHDKHVPTQYPSASDCNTVHFSSFHTTMRILQGISNISSPKIIAKLVVQHIISIIFPNRSI